MKKEKMYKCFVIMPYGKTEEEKMYYNKLYEKAIKTSANRILEYEVLLDRADTNLKDFELRKNVHKHLDGADFCIADISGLNPNVLYEIGYARAHEKEVIVISQDKSPYPIDVADITISPYSIDNDNSLEILSQNLSGLVEKAITFIETKATSVKGVYEVICFQDRKSANLGEVFENANKNIDILQTNLSTIEQEYLTSLVHALENKVSLRILTLDPDSYFAQKRAEQLGLAIAHYRNELHNNIRSIIKELSKFGSLFSLRIYDDFPTQITFIIDEFIYTCTVARDLRSRELCTFMLRKNAAGAERSFYFHFRAIWSNAREYLVHTLT